MTVQMFAPSQGDDVEQGIYEPQGPMYEMTIAAVVRPPSDVALDEARTTVERFRGNGMAFPYEFWEQYHSEFLNYGQAYLLVLADGHDGVAAVTAALGSLVAPGEQPPFSGPLEAFSRRASFEVLSIWRRQLCSRLVSGWR